MFRIIEESKDGLILTDKQAILDRWCDFFREKFSKYDHNHTSGEYFQNQNSDEVPPPELFEIENAIKKLKNNKATGHDHIPAELLKCHGPVLLKVISNLITDIWNAELLPSDWSTSTLR